MSESSPHENDGATRCPCGDNNDTEGFMIQCEQCAVWQHGECIGIHQKAVPEDFYCELCAPDHLIQQRRIEWVQHVQSSQQARRGFKVMSFRAMAKAIQRTLVAPTTGNGKRKRPSKSKPAPSSPSLGALPADSLVNAVDSRTSTKRSRAGEATPQVQADPSVASPPPSIDALPPQTSSDPSMTPRDQRKLQKILDSFAKLEEKQRRSAPVSSPGPKPTLMNCVSSSDDVPPNSRPSHPPPPPANQSARRPNSSMHHQQFRHTVALPPTTGSALQTPCVVTNPAQIPPRPRHFRPLGPVYFGKKHFLLSQLREEQRIASGASSRDTSLSEVIPSVHKRLLFSFSVPDGATGGAAASSSSSSSSSSSLSHPSSFSLPFAARLFPNVHHLPHPRQQFLEDRYRTSPYLGVSNSSPPALDSGPPPNPLDLHRLSSSSSIGPPSAAAASIPFPFSSSNESSVPQPSLRPPGQDVYLSPTPFREDDLNDRGRAMEVDSTVEASPSQPANDALHPSPLSPRPIDIEQPLQSAQSPAGPADIDSEQVSLPSQTHDSPIQPAPAATGNDIVMSQAVESSVPMMNGVSHVQSSSDTASSSTSAVSSSSPSPSTSFALSFPTMNGFHSPEVSLSKKLQLMPSMLSSSFDSACPAAASQAV